MKKWVRSLWTELTRSRIQKSVGLLWKRWRFGVLLLPGIYWIAEGLSALHRGSLHHGIHWDIPVFFHTVRDMHLSYREANFSIPCWYQSVIFLISRHVVTVHKWRSFLNLWPPRFSSLLETDYNCSVKISLVTTISGIYSTYASHINLFSDRLSFFTGIFSASLFMGNICKKVSPFTFNRHSSPNK